ncbi:YezD family protein [Paenibacillus senegalensis]|uniref:YezD family protein n=1 Tax=Paenibacillus senegalensis TaxID=1465766 RepID=UPI00028825C9|nr:YezD family protein [Paenibacillus senegalensis]
MAKLVLDEQWLERIKANLEGMEFGAVQIVVHEGRIVQIERTEKNRYDAENQSLSRRRSSRG